MSQDIECTRCEGSGEVCGVTPSRRSHFVGYDDLSPDDYTDKCSDCDGTGWRPMTEDEEADAAEAAEQDRIHGEPPVTLAEQHRAAWDQKRSLRS